MIEKPRTRLHGHTYHDTKWLVAGICGLSVLGWLINSWDPDSALPLIIFFAAIFVTAFSITFFLTNIVRRSFLVSSGVFGLLLLRYLGLRQPYYLILLVLCLISLELYLQKR